MSTCNEIVAEWPQPGRLTKRYVCTAKRGTYHSHAEGLALGTLRRLLTREHETLTDRHGCSYLADRLGNREVD